LALLHFTVIIGLPYLVHYEYFGAFGHFYDLRVTSLFAGAEFYSYCCRL